MELWSTREQSLNYLKTNQQKRLDVFNCLLSIIDECIDLFEKNADNDTHSRACGLALLKAKNLAISSYSLILDGHGQEAGALLRPMCEYIELLTYLRFYPDDAEKAFNDTLPSAGVRAQKIEGYYKDLRGYLNKHASHSSFSSYSIAHLLNPDFSFRKMQEFHPHVLDRNFLDLAVQMAIMVQEATLTLGPKLEKNYFHDLAIRIENLKNELFEEFDKQD